MFEVIALNSNKLNSKPASSELCNPEKVGPVTNFTKLFSIFEKDPAKRESFAKLKLLGSSKKKIYKRSNNKLVQSPSVKRKQNTNNLIDHGTRSKKPESPKFNTSSDC